MDAISTGLDSATTFSVCQSLKNAAEALQKTFVVTLLQPPPEVRRRRRAAAAACVDNAAAHGWRVAPR